MKNMRKSRFFQKDAYIAVDFLEKNTEVVRMDSIEGTPDPLAMVIDLGNNKGSKQIRFENPPIHEVNAIRTELQQFAKAIINQTETPVPLRDGLEALETAHVIVEKLKNSFSIKP